ncbi:protein DEK isoform 1-T3 [Pholidichthys leucotaenia]
MNEAAEEAVDSPAVSEEDMDDQQETSRDEETSLEKSSNKISAVGEIIEGKRTKKTVERLDLQAPKQKEKLKITDGSGEKLGDIPRTNLQITKMKPADLKPLHAILFDRPGKMATIKKNLRLFNGFAFSVDSEQFSKKREKLLKNSNFTNTKLKVVCGVLDLEKKGTHADLVDRILQFLVAPKNSGKRLPVKKKRKSKKKLSGDDSETKTKKKKSKPKSSSTSSSPKKSKAGKSKAIVMDSSSDEDDEDEEDEEKMGVEAEAEGSDGDEEKLSEKEEEDEKSEESGDDDDDDDEEEEEFKSKSRGKTAAQKSSSVKRQRTPSKKTGPPKKKAKRAESDESEEDSEEDEKPKKKKPAAAKSKKADSSSSRSKKATVEDSSDDDEPLINMIKKGPTDEELKETIQRLLKEANLADMTMKLICQRVYDTYPGHDLSSKKQFIKDTVKALIT